MTAATIRVTETMDWVRETGYVTREVCTMVAPDVTTAADRYLRQFHGIGVHQLSSAWRVGHLTVSHPDGRLLHNYTFEVI